MYMNTQLSLYIRISIISLYIYIYYLWILFRCRGFPIGGSQSQNAPLVAARAPLLETAILGNLHLAKRFLSCDGSPIGGNPFQKSCLFTIYLQV